ncbi:heme utilization cystosolic carrier protein HutX [Microvirga brassicacearum]|uniref:Heme utilization cystosolic carrier protein HutX n=1 Tax=Microvirga brassicacearum TaxID=2580413 RepID=A0A5N3P873_9HYPH|nr:heme utilization cystosolic carrier protein HutX [Microvirga brassicacearum]KAB0265933.1 heme utilization cystosolic carrier protein HutX [Microvirga brassicacearum]
MMRPLSQTSVSCTTEASIRQGLEAKSDGVLEVVAADHNVPLQRVVDSLPAGMAIAADGSLFEQAWRDMTEWGEMTFIVHTRDGVFECSGAIPPESAGRGYFNVRGESPLSGHLKAERCRSIYFVDRPFFGKRSCPVHFINIDGEAMFKIFVGRNGDRSLKGDQVARFEALREMLSQHAHFAEF